jgi:hypothetical protein
MSSVRGFISRNAFLLKVTSLLALSYGWMFIAFGDELIKSEPSILLFFQLLVEHYYTMFPIIPLIPVLARPPDTF